MSLDGRLRRNTVAGELPLDPPGTSNASARARLACNTDANPMAIIGNRYFTSIARWCEDPYKEKDLVTAAGAHPQNHERASSSEGKCPVAHGARGRRNRDWWPDALDISVLHRNSSLSDPMGDTFDYAKEFQSLDLNAVLKDLH